MERPCIFKQLIANDQKKKAKKGEKVTEKMTDKLQKNLRYLLIERDDFAEKLCCLGSTSHCEANHARIIRRGLYSKGENSKIFLFDPDLTFFDLNLTLI